MKQKDTVSVRLKFEPYDPAKQGWPPQDSDIGDKITIEIKRHDGLGLTQGQARAILAQYLISTVGKR